MVVPLPDSLCFYNNNMNIINMKGAPPPCIYPPSIYMVLTPFPLCEILLHIMNTYLTGAVNYYKLNCNITLTWLLKCHSKGHLILPLHPPCQHDNLQFLDDFVSFYKILIKCKNDDFNKSYAECNLKKEVQCNY